MAARSSIDVHALLGKQLERASPDLLRELINTMADALMSADADSVCDAYYAQRPSERVNVRNGHRSREWDTRTRLSKSQVSEMAKSLDGQVTA